MTKVAIIGAGVAGLAAAAALRGQGAEVTVLEASARAGGRAHTTTPALLDCPFDHGAAWLHAAERNPLAALARQAGDRVTDSGTHRVQRTRIGGRCATDAELAAYEAAEQAFQRCTQAALAGPDTSLAEAVAPIAALPWLLAVLNWEAPVIAAADARALSLRDWHANQLTGTNLEVDGGLGAFILRRLLPPAGPIHLNTPALAVHWDGPGIGVVTASGTLRADACIVTVSTGVLASGTLRFCPALPVPVQAAIDGLPMGTLNKVALRASGTDRLDLPDHCGIDQFVPAIDAPAMSTIAWPRGHGHIVTFHGGSHAADWEAGDMLEDQTRAQLRAMFGSRAQAAFRPGAVVTRWMSHPWTRGAYAYARPGAAVARSVLATPLAGGRLIFAGEAVQTDGLAGTVGGAYLSGQSAARRMGCPTAPHQHPP